MSESSMTLLWGLLKIHYPAALNKPINFPILGDSYTLHPSKVVLKTLFYLGFATSIFYA